MLHLDVALVQNQVFGLFLYLFVLAAVAGLRRAGEDLRAELQLLDVVGGQGHHQLLVVAHVDQLGAHLGRPVSNVVGFEDAGGQRVDQELLGSNRVDADAAAVLLANQGA
jgi:hypothetical protein